ncbi:MAG: ester cyclase [Methylovulum sp.]|nr:ester cyclase [Methylovulum sp.]
MKKLIYGALLISLFMPTYSYAGAVETTAANTTKAVSANPDLNTIKAFYDLLGNPDTDVAILKEHAASVIGLKWDAIPTPLGGLGLEGFAQTFSRYHQAIPDMKWEPQSILKSGSHTYTVRSLGSGTPVFDFLGIGAEWVPGNHFEIMTIDIHTVKNGKIIRTYHVEDWRDAMRQLKAVQ